MTDKGTPYMSFGNDEINSAPDLTDPVQCHVCKGHHPAQPSETRGDGPATVLQFIACDKTGKTYLVGINGKDIRGRGSGGTVPDE